MKQRTRIVCTLGPASDTDDIVRAMIRAGMDVARLNFSHGDQAAHAERIERVRRIAQEEKALVALLADLQGPKIRVGGFAEGVVGQGWLLQHVQPPRLDVPFHGFVRANRHAFQQRGGLRGKIEVIVNDRCFQRHRKQTFLLRGNGTHAILLLLSPF